jgi:hypothetical protein
MLQYPHNIGLGLFCEVSDMIRMIEAWEAGNGPADGGADRLHMREVCERLDESIRLVKDNSTAIEFQDTDMVAVLETWEASSPQ